MSEDIGSHEENVARLERIDKNIKSLRERYKSNEKLNHLQVVANPEVVESKNSDLREALIGSVGTAWGKFPEADIDQASEIADLFIGIVDRSKIVTMNEIEGKREFFAEVAGRFMGTPIASETGSNYYGISFQSNMETVLGSLKFEVDTHKDELGRPGFTVVDKFKS